MKRKAFPLILTMALLSLAVIGIHLTAMTAANPVMHYEIPTKPDTNAPSVTVNSPLQNQTFDSQNITLSFTVIKPETWIRLTKYSDTVYLVLGNVTSFYNVVDGVKSQSFMVNDISSVYSDNPKQTLDFSLNLTVPKGQHTLYVGVEAQTIYRQNLGSIMDPHSSFLVSGVSEVINFTIAKPFEPEPQPLPIAPVFVVSASTVVVVAVLLVYFKKHKQVMLDGYG